MRFFANINGYNILYSDVDNDIVDVKVIKKEQNNFKYIVFSIPNMEILEEDNIDEASKKYLYNIINNCKDRIFQDSVEHVGRVIENIQAIRVDEEGIIIEGNFLDNEQDSWTHFKAWIWLFRY